MATQEIKLKIHEEADMFTPYDPDQTMLEEEISDYLIRCYGNVHRKSKEEFVIHIYSDTPVNEERVKKVIRDHCEQEKANSKHEIKMETYREITLAIVGVVLLSIWFVLSASIESVWMEIISIMGWVAVWEATSIAIMRRPELHFTSKKYDIASRAEIIFDVVESPEEE